MVSFRRLPRPLGFPLAISKDVVGVGGLEQNSAERTKH
jgi:hypothetical protein